MNEHHPPHYSNNDECTPLNRINKTTITRSSGSNNSDNDDKKKTSSSFVVADIVPTTTTTTTTRRRSAAAAATAFGLSALLLLVTLMYKSSENSRTSDIGELQAYDLIRGGVNMDEEDTTFIKTKTKYGNMGSTKLEKKSSKDSKSSKKGPKSRKASLRIVETIDPQDPDGSGDIILSLGFNPLTNSLSLVGSNFVTNGSVFLPKDIKVIDGELIGDIPFEKQIGDSSSTCTITKGTFKPEQNIIFIESATCNYSTCFPKTPVNPETDLEQCFFGISGGTLNIDGAQLIFGEAINGILLGGTFGFEGLQGTFVVNKIVQGQFPPPSPPVIQYNVFQIDFDFTTDDDNDFDPFPNPFE